MTRKKIKGTKVRRASKEEPNFYHPAWKNHFGQSFPPSVTNSHDFEVTLTPCPMPERVVSPVSAGVSKPILVDQLPSATPVVSIGDGSERSRWKVSLPDENNNQATDILNNDRSTVIIPSSVLQNSPLYDNPFEPRPIRETPVPIKPASFFF